MTLREAMDRLDDRCSALEALVQKRQAKEDQNPEVIVPRVLIVEDAPVYRQAFKEHLHAHFPSLAIDEARSAEEALQKISKTSPPDFMFIDIRLPEADGLQLTQKIKKDFPRIRIAMLTGYDFPEYRRAASQYGADRYFVKDSLEWKEIEEFVQSIPDNNQ